MLASVRSGDWTGRRSPLVRGGVAASPRGLPGYTVVGLPDAAGRESRERVRAALLSSGLAYPQTRVTVNLAPAAVRKSGAGLELAIALGLLAAADALPAGVLDDVAVLGELGLDGRVRPVVGARHRPRPRPDRVTHVIVPRQTHEAALVPGATVRVARSLGELHACLKGEVPWPDPPEPPPMPTDPADTDEPLDLIDVRGLEPARHALSVAAAGAHHALFVGPPGVGKTMLARRLPTIMAPLLPDEALEVAKVHSAAGSGRGSALRTDPPFRARTTAHPPSRSSAAAVPRADPARSPSRTGEPCSSTSCRSSRSRCSSRCASRSRSAPYAPAARGNDDVSGRLLAGGVRQPVPVRPYVGAVPLQRHAAGPVRTATVGAAARSVRHPAGDPGGRHHAGESSADAAARVAAAVERQQARLQGTPWRRNAHVPAGARVLRRPLDRGQCGLARLVRNAHADRPGRGTYPASCTHRRRPARPGRDRGARRRPRRVSTGGPVVSRRTHRWERAGENFPVRDADLLDATVDAGCRACCWAKAIASTRSTRRGSRSSARAPRRRWVSPTRGRSPRSARAPASPS